MKKRLLCCLIASVFCLTAACSSQGGAANGGSQPKTAAEETVTQETAASADTSAASSAAEVSTAEESAAQAAAAPGNVSADGYTGMYEDERGWYVLYDPTLFTVEEAEDDVKFLYTGEAVGENYVEIRYIPDKQAREVLTAELEELTEEFEVDEEEIVREEAYFYEDKWCYTSSVEISEDDRDITVSYQSAEYNGGVLLTKLVEGVTDENILEGYMADALWYILDTIAFYDYQPQEEFYYVPGTYSKTAAAADHVVEDAAEENTLSADEAFAQAPDQIILQNDHTGSFVTEEKAPIYWGSCQLTRKNTVDTYEYDVEGDNLYLNIGGDWIEYEKTGEAAADDGRLDNPEYLQELDQEIDILYNGGIGKTGRIRKMQAFILELALHAKTQNPDFAMIVQNAGYLAYNDGRFEDGDQSYIKDLVDGWSTEGVVGKGDSLTPSVFQKIYIDQVKKGKFVSDTTTVRDQEELQNYLARANAWGITPFPKLGGELA